VVRLLEGALGDEDSAENDSFREGLLEYPQYTRPPGFRGREVPAVLLSGNHAEIRRWRLERSREKTRSLRPDLLDRRERLQMRNELHGPQQDDDAGS
jgi:tRNA (guanine37-N1)-methyltransferase